jgi:hypothetical protein
MELKQILSLEVVRNDKVYRLELPIGVPLGEAYEATWEMLKKIVELVNESVDKAKMETKQANGDD